MGARAVRGRSGLSDGGSDTWDIEIPAFDKASLYQTMVTEVPAFFLPKQRCVQLKPAPAWKGKNTYLLKRSNCYLTRVSQICFTAIRTLNFCMAVGGKVSLLFPLKVPLAAESKKRSKERSM
jgi:hypothetical protein